MLLYYLKEMDVVLGVRQFFQFSLILLLLSNLLLYLLQQLLSLTDNRLFLGSDQLSHLEPLQLNGVNQFSEDGVTLFSCCPSRALEGDTQQESS